MTSFPTVDPNDDLRLRYRGAGSWTDEGVLPGHRALCAEVRLPIAPLMAARRRPVLSTSPVSHVAGMLMSILVPPLFGHDVHLMD